MQDGLSTVYGFPLANVLPGYVVLQYLSSGEVSEYVSLINIDWAKYDAGAIFASHAAVR